MKLNEFATLPLNVEDAGDLENRLMGVEDEEGNLEDGGLGLGLEPVVGGLDLDLLFVPFHL